jgi:hypothetical protein
MNHSLEIESNRKVMLTPVKELQLVLKLLGNALPTIYIDFIRSNNNRKTIPNKDLVSNPKNLTEIELN